MDYKLCRLCLANNRETALLNIFNTEGLNNMFLKLQKCLPFRIHVLDGLPKLICYQCLANLDTCYNFLNKAIKSNEVLRKHCGREHQGSRAIGAKTLSTPQRVDYDDEDLEDDEIKSVSRPCIPRRPMFIERRQNTTRWVVGSKPSSSSSEASSKHEPNILDTIGMPDDDSDNPPVFITAKTEASKCQPAPPPKMKPEGKPPVKEECSAPRKSESKQTQEKVLPESKVEPEIKHSSPAPQGCQPHTKKHSSSVQLSQETEPKVPKIDSKLPVPDNVNQSIQNHSTNQLIPTNNVPIEAQYQYVHDQSGVQHPNNGPVFTPLNNWPIRPHPLHSNPSAFHVANNQNPMFNYQYNSMPYPGMLPNYIQNYGFNPLVNMNQAAIYQHYSQLNSIPSISNINSQLNSIPSESSNNSQCNVEVNKIEEPEQKPVIKKNVTEVVKEDKEKFSLQENLKVKVLNKRKSNQSSSSELTVKVPQTPKTNTPKRASKVVSPMLEDHFGFDLNFCKACNATLAPHENLFKHMLALHSKNED